MNILFHGCQILVSKGKPFTYYQLSEAYVRTPLRRASTQFEVQTILPGPEIEGNCHHKRELFRYICFSLKDPNHPKMTKVYLKLMDEVRTDFQFSWEKGCEGSTAMGHRNANQNTQNLTLETKWLPGSNLQDLFPSWGSTALLGTVEGKLEAIGNL